MNYVCSPINILHRQRFLSCKRSLVSVRTQPLETGETNRTTNVGRGRRIPLTDTAGTRSTNFAGEHSHIRLHNECSESHNQPSDDSISPAHAWLLSRPAATSDKLEHRTIGHKQHRTSKTTSTSAVIDTYTTSQHYELCVDGFELIRHTANNYYYYHQLFIFVATYLGIYNTE